MNFPNYWLFQGNGKSYNFDIAVPTNQLKVWNVKAHKDKIKDGDKVIIWLSGKKAGCYALADIVGKLFNEGIAEDNHLWNVIDENGLKHKREDKDTDKIGIRITHNVFNTPILWKEVKSLESLKQLKAGYRGTNFVSSKNEYDTFLSLINNRNIP